MTYSEIKNTYHWALKTYPGISSGSLINSGTFEDKIIGTCEKINYNRHGGRWVEVSRETEPMTAQYYLNCVDAIPFFRNGGGSERVELGYTCKGYMPTRISAADPMRICRTVRVFRFN